MKLRKQAVVFLALAMLTTTQFGFAQEKDCGAEPPKNYDTFMLKRLKSITDNGSKALATPVSLPIQHHVSRNSSGGSPAVSSAQIQNVMDELNATYAPMNISFHEYAPTKYIDKTSWNNSFNKSNDSQLVQYEVAEAINIFYFSEVTSGSSTICGFAKFPGTGNRAILDASCSQNGSTSSHELGHYFSILHTHSTSNGRELVQRTNCSSAGDFFCDTPADPRLSSLVNSSCNYTGTATDANGDQYQPDVNNVMSYTRKSCRTGGFSSQQQNAIVASLESDRAYLTSPTNPPVCSTISNFPYSESFESGLGDWTNATGDDIEWTRDSNGTPSSGTGPSTAQNGSFYLYTEASTNVTPAGSPNKTAILNSPCIDLPQAGNMSLEFGYHMLGRDIGTIEVLVSTNDGTSYTSIWSQNGAKGDTWNQATVDLSGYSGSVIRLQFKGTTGTSWRSDIAIDNIKIKETVTNPSSCNGITSFPYNESFESGIGEWTQETSDNINWTVDSNSTPSSSTGPSSATNGSNYIFTEASGSGNGFPNKVALLTSPCVDLTSESNAELSFDYHMYGSNMGTLEIRVSTNDGVNWTTAWSKNGNQGNSWSSQTVNLSAYSGSTIKLQLKGTTGSSYRSDMAIDNLKITSGSADSDLTDNEIRTANPKISIYPNPIASGSLSIQHPGFSKNGGKTQITITDFLGKTIDIVDSNNETTAYDVSNLSNGVYFIIINNKEGQVTQKFIKR
ncbi:T9SS-dependent choice-of-anchor J family protein [Aquimarina megaterium]|uniref:T9SS-dependent choice-of-anchor J family protein n=1 Tax=Aquimarina megaterium TaxID=1443666 RepID=UPI000471D7F7|nr:choice-of-anchor J domain-containing protein [Aquimarina megaterium]